MPIGSSPRPFGSILSTSPIIDQNAEMGVLGIGARYASADPIGLRGNAGAAPLQGASAKKAAPAVTKELNIVGGKFDWDPPITDAQEITKLTSNLWSPGTKDFTAVVNGVSATAVLADSFGAFLGAIVTSPKGSITRINLLSHANPDVIAFSGRIRSTATVGRDVLMDVNGPGSTMVSLDTQSIQAIAAPGVFFQLPGNPRKFTIDDIRDRFAPGAVILLLACHSGVLATFLQDIANFFRVTVIGFTKEIAYCPQAQTNPMKFIRTGMQIGVGSCANKVADFRTLSANSNAVTKNSIP